MDNTSITLTKFIRHLITVHNHRKWVRHYCWKMGLFWQGLTHDLSKYSPTELFESVRYYTGTSSPINEAKKDKGYSMAWFHHKGRNKHHYEYWMDNFDQGGENIPMPPKYFAELFCDYLAAGRAYNPNSKTPYQDEYKWWLAKKERCAMHPAMKECLTSAFYRLSEWEKEDLGENTLVFVEFQILYIRTLHKEYGTYYAS